MGNSASQYKKDNEPMTIRNHPNNKQVISNNSSDSRATQINTINKHNQENTQIKSFASRDSDVSPRVSFARIRRLRKSPRYLLAILQGKITVSTNLRDSPQNFRNHRADKCPESWLAKLPRRPGDRGAVSCPGPEDVRRGEERRSPRTKR